MPKDRLEQAVIAQIRERVLNDEWLEQLVRLVNQELDASHNLLVDKLEAIDGEISEIRLRLSRLYEALETAKLSIDDLAPRIKDQRARESELTKARLSVEAEMLMQGPNHLDAETIKAHARDLKAILEEADLASSKAFLKTFVKRIEINGTDAVIRYTLPVPPTGETKDRVSILPIETPGGEGGI